MEIIYSVNFPKNGQKCGYSKVNTETETQHKDLTRRVDTHQTAAEETRARALLFTHDPATGQAVVNQFVFLS